MQQDESAEETRAGNYNTQKSMCVEEEEEAEAEEDTPGSRKSQKHKLNLKLKVLKSSVVFFRFSLARIRPKFNNFFPDFYTWFN
jgi:hypothetical protein